MIANWYAERDYNFLALTDHNVLSEGMRWMKLTDIVKRSDAEIVDRYVEQFGESGWKPKVKKGHKTTRYG